MSDDIERAVRVNPLNLDHYLHEEFYERAYQIAHPKLPSSRIRHSKLWSAGQIIANLQLRLYARYDDGVLFQQCQF